MLRSESMLDPWSFTAFQFYVDVFRTATESTVSDPALLAQEVAKIAKMQAHEVINGSVLTPLIKCEPMPEYTNVIVWENAPLMACDRALLRVYLEMALNLTKPVGILGNVMGVRPNGAGVVDVFNDDPGITMDLFILVHCDDLPLFMKPRSIQMGLRFYDELICQGKRFSAVPPLGYDEDDTLVGVDATSITDESQCPPNIWTAPKN